MPINPFGDAGHCLTDWLKVKSIVKIVIAIKENKMENYEKKYKEALEWIREIYPTMTVCDKEDAEYYFSELVENENERIRKHTITILENYISYFEPRTPNSDTKKHLVNKAKKCIAWLEKQSEEARNIALRTEYEKGRADAIAEISKMSKEADSQIWQIANNSAKTWEQSFAILQATQTAYNKGKKDALKEQKPTDKTEPKFHEGDWVVYVCGEESTTLQISRIIEGTYEFTDGSSLNVVDEDTLHLWTIQDAKDGDVLAVENMIFIYKTVLASHIVSHCKLFSDKFEFFNDVRTCCEGNSKVHPATKEQRALLFQKMHEAGYEWEAEKKELKKIEDEPEHPYCQEHCKGYKESGGKCYFGFNCKEKREAEKQPAWSEEDENWLINAINVCKLNNYNETAEWLKSLKERIL